MSFARRRLRKYTIAPRTAIPTATPTPTPAPIATRLSEPDLGVEIGVEFAADVGRVFPAFAKEDEARKAVVLALAVRVAVDCALVRLVAVRTV